jgi:histidyl-tRNA synthetase
MPIIQPVKGTRDFYPEEMALRKWLYQKIQTVSELFGYQEYEGPILEPFALYVAKSGEELVKENFAFPDKGGDMITLRPELTPSLARMVAQRQKQLVYPLKWWSFGPFWRYERPQKGRAREFFQWNIDMIGVDSVQADAELVAIGATFFKHVGLNPGQVKILVNDRQLIDIELGELGIPAHTRSFVLKLIDKRDKLTYEEWQGYAIEIGLTLQQVRGLETILTNTELWKKSPDLTVFFDAVEALGIADWVKYAPNIIRGLDYYTRIVFEAWDKDGEFRAILGGGRYDNLVKDMGGEPLSGIGFAMGDMTCALVLKKFNCIPDEIRNLQTKVLITIFSSDTFNESLQLSNELREAGIPVSCYPEAVKIARQFKYGDRMGFELAIILGPEEISNQTISIKNLKTGEQENISRRIAAERIKAILSYRK